MESFAEKRIKSVQSSAEPTSTTKSKRERENGGRTIWRNIIWLIILFIYSSIGGLTFSAIEGGHDRLEQVRAYEREVDLLRNRTKHRNAAYHELLEIQQNFTTSLYDPSENEISEIVDAVFERYDRAIGVSIDPPVLRDTKWNFWAGVYYSASLYTTIGYGNYHPRTRSGQIISMIYAFCGIPLVFTILLEWGFLYFTWIEMFWKWFNSTLCIYSIERHTKKRLHKEKLRIVGSDLSLRSSSSLALINRSNKDAIFQTDHQIETGKKIVQLETELNEHEKTRTVPLKAALIFFFLWILISAFIVRFWESNWSYFTAYYFFFTSLTTIGLGDVVTETPNFIIFNLALTMVGLSVVGLCIAIVQAKIRLIFNRMIRSIDGQYRIRQIDPDIATMSLITDEKEGIKQLCESQPIQDRIIYLAMDEHKKQLLEDRWKSRSNMINRITQTWQKRMDKCIQTGQRVDEQPKSILNPDDNDSDESNDCHGEYKDGSTIPPPNTRRYIYTVFD